VFFFCFVGRRVASHYKAETVGPYRGVGWEISVGRSQCLWAGWLSHSDAGLWSNEAGNCRTVFATSVAGWQRRRQWRCLRSCYGLLTDAYHDSCVVPSRALQPQRHSIEACTQRRSLTERKLHLSSVQGDITELKWNTSSVVLHGLSSVKGRGGSSVLFILSVCAFVPQQMQMIICTVCLLIFRILLHGPSVLQHFCCCSSIYCLSAFFWHHHRGHCICVWCSQRIMHNTFIFWRPFCWHKTLGR